MSAEGEVSGGSAAEAEQKAEDSGAAAPPEENAPASSDAASAGRSLQPVTTLLAILAAIALAAALRATSAVLIPFVLAMFLCYLITPVASFLARFRVPEILTLPAAILVLLGVLLLLGSAVVATIGEITDRVPFYVDRAETLVQHLEEALGAQWESLSEVDWIAKAADAVSSLTADLFGSFINFAANLVLVLTYTAFILLGRKAFAANLSRAFSVDRAEELREIIGKVNLQVQRYIATKILLSAATGFFMFLALWFFGVDFALFWGLLGFLFNFIPTIGSAIAAILPITLSIVQFGDPLTTLWVALCLIGTQQLIGNAIEPALQGERLNLSPIVVLFALVFFGWLWGFWGMVLSVPLMATLKITFEHSKALKPLAIMLEKG